ncbi:MAG: cellulose synthase [Streptosporangiaceae bacterium]
MSSYSQIAWLPLCGGVTGVGLVASYLVYRRRGFTAGLRGAAWSLLPMAAYLTQSVQTLWDMGVKLVDFATGFVLSPERWAGIALTGVALVAFVVSGLMRRTRPAKDGASSDRPGKVRTGKGTAKASAGKSDATPTQAIERHSTRKAAALPNDDDDFSEIEKILRNRGIN